MNKGTLLKVPPYEGLAWETPQRVTWIGWYLEERPPKK